MQDRILQISESGIETADLKVKSLMQNMVNARTPGFKESDVVVRAFPLYLERAEARQRAGTVAGETSRAEGVFQNPIPGTLLQTGKDTDLAIAGDGYFVIQCPWGEGYTKDGRFRKDTQGSWKSINGDYPLMGMSGAIEVSPGSEITISPQGEVLADKVMVDKIRIVDFAHRDKLGSVGGTIFRMPEGKNLETIELSTPRILQGYLETSNVNVINQMVNLILLSRIYGVNTKVVQTRDLVLSRALEMGKPAQ